MSISNRIVAALAFVAATSPLAAQSATIVYRLGSDTVAIEQFTRTATKVSGEMIQRSGAAVVQVTYHLDFGADGRPVSAKLSRFNGDGSSVVNTFNASLFRFRSDSAFRDNQFTDSLQRRGFAVGKAFMNFPVFVYGPTEQLLQLKKRGIAIDSMPALGINGNPGFIGLQAASGDTLRLRGQPYAMQVVYDKDGNLQTVDGSYTTNKIIGTRTTKKFDLVAMARGWKPTGVLSVRDVARGAFGTGGIVLVDYGRPQVRERTVWGGALVPYDSIWRAGANDATHLFTTRTLAFGSVTLAPGMYTLWVQHTKNGTFLIVNRQVGQWGTQYDPAQDVGRVQMQMTPTASHVEEFTIAVKSQAQNRGTLEMSWGSSTFSAPFTATAAPPGR